MENNGREQWDPTFLLQWDVHLGIFHGLIAKKPIPGPSENNAHDRTDVTLDLCDFVTA